VVFDSADDFMAYPHYILYCSANLSVYLHIWRQTGNHILCLYVVFGL
jgi:hypothetical protein